MSQGCLRMVSETKSILVSQGGHRDEEQSQGGHRDEEQCLRVVIETRSSVSGWSQDGQ